MFFCDLCFDFQIFEIFGAGSEHLNLNIGISGGQRKIQIFKCIGPTIGWPRHS